VYSATDCAQIGIAPGIISQLLLRRRPAIIHWHFTITGT
jgi:hypothetical protein